MRSGPTRTYGRWLRRAPMTDCLANSSRVRQATKPPNNDAMDAPRELMRFFKSRSEGLTRCARALGHKGARSETATAPALGAPGLFQYVDYAHNGSLSRV